MLRSVATLSKRSDAARQATRRCSKGRSLWTGGFEDSTESSSRKRLLLFDIANDQSPFSSQRTHSYFSPNTIRSRLALHYKGLAYTQSWISYPEIEPLWQELKIPIPPHEEVSGTKRRTSPTCTLPILLLGAEDFQEDALTRLHDAKIPGVHETVQTRYGIFTPVVSTLGIAMALEVLFRDGDPERYYPPLFPDRFSIEQTQDVQSIVTGLLPATRRLIIPSVPDILDDRGKEYFTRTRCEWFGVSSLDELRPKTPEETDRLWADIEAKLEPILRTLHDCPLVKGPELHDSLDWNIEGDPRARSAVSEQSVASSVPVRYLSGGPSPTYADFILMAFLAWIARVDMDAWARLTLYIGDGVLEDLWMGCLPYLRSGVYVETLEWFKPDLKRPYSLRK
ncbi:uncharacterized protein Z520_06168 [Fonsecaea multimorphosa CBS 102226]|uniref:Glutathione S-transferase UstS-like C-terminal domain-containing protein n=1 Tax=Fonsecaea multimorphosa CBS 102226 TaxID=1442371 RepID=A0A0D2KN10_9EURO|nr:uncharacterized protein Z520_06168 [Fonsecaea multimorphosa CBS 102226]KIX98088.1 hypothetical protein Z520_06168 [Fonsecaea multimorphosa CBS 102226]OAL24171.1 hypothetical protein AYO22_05831 [Fonsecaea multimorphosa]